MIKWQCPQCKAIPNTHGRTPECKQGLQQVGCSGFTCNCWAHNLENAETEAQDHGRVITNPCHHAECAHCGWSGTFPYVFDQKTLPGWAKTAWAAGWKPPEGWAPSGLDIMIGIVEEES